MERSLKVKIVNNKLALEHVNGPATKGSAAFDLRACIHESITIYPQSKPVMIHTGISVDGGDDTENPYTLLLFIRSSMGAKHGITLANGVGLIDSDYRGEIILAVVNLSDEPYTIQPFDRVAQLACMPIDRIAIDIVSELSETERGAGGFGSTGVG